MLIRLLDGLLDQQTLHAWEIVTKISPTFEVFSAINFGDQNCRLRVVLDVRPPANGALDPDRRIKRHHGLSERHGQMERASAGSDDEAHPAVKPAQEVDSADPRPPVKN